MKIKTGTKLFKYGGIGAITIKSQNQKGPQSYGMV